MTQTVAPDKQPPKDGQLAGVEESMLVVSREDASCTVDTSCRVSALDGEWVIIAFVLYSSI